MQRDMDLVRTILLEVEDLPAGGSGAVAAVDGVDPAVFAAHVDLMKQARLVEAAVAHADGIGPIGARVYRLTWEGNDFLDAVRDDTVWNRTKSKVLETAGTVSLEVIKAVAVSISRSMLDVPPV